MSELLDDKGDGPQTEQVTQLEGSYLLEVLSTSVFSDAETHELSTMRTEIRARVMAVADDEGSDLTLAPCSLRLPEVSGFEPKLPRETLARLPAAAARVRVARQQGGVTQQLQSEPFAFPIGLRLDDPLRDPVPVDPDSPAVVDLEGDDQPGVTLHIAGFSVYLAARLSCELFGQIEQQAGQAPRVQGTLNIAMDQQVYGDSIPFVDVAERVAASEATEVLISEEHTFKLVPTSDPLSCQLP